VEKLYPKVSGPVSTGTRILSPFIQWDHSKSYRLTKFPDYFNFLNSREDESYTIDFMDNNDQYVRDHCIDGRVLVPATGYLLFAWRSLAFHMKIGYQEFPVEFRDVQILRATPVPANGKVKLYVNLDPHTGRFHIVDSGTIVVSGTVRAITDGQPLRYESVFNEIQSMADETGANSPIRMQTKDVYKVLRTRGYNYGPEFRCITGAHECRDTYVVAGIEWRQNWVTFSDCLLQTYILGIASFRHCAGLEIRGVRASPLQRNVKSQKPALRSYGFVAFDEYFTHERQKAFLEYQRRCDELALNAANGRTISGQQSDQSCDTTVAQLMSEITEESQTFCKILTALSDGKSGANLAQELDQDIQCSSYGERNYLRSQLTIVTENRNELSGNRVDVLEVNESSVPMYGTVMSAMDILQYSLDIHYVLMQSKRKTNYQEVDTKAYSNTYTLNDSCVGPDVSDNAVDLIVYKDQSLCHLAAEDTVNEDIDTLFASFWQKLAENGFLLIVLKNKWSFAEKYIRNELALKRYDQMAISRDATVTSAVQRIGFRLVSHKSDCFSVHSLLYRKIISEPSIGKQIFIDFTNNYRTWLQSFQRELSGIGDKPVDQNIWLVANGSAEGLLGFVKCIRKEPNGHRVRALQIMDTSGGDERQKPRAALLDKTNAVFNDIIKNDLAINVVSGGQTDATDLLRNKTFDGIQVDTLFAVNDKTSPKMLRDREKIWDLIRDGIGAGVVQPLNRTVYGHHRCEEAFRFMASGRHVGKVVVRIRDEEPSHHTFEFTPIKMAAIPRTVFFAHKTYVMTGGLGGMGLEIIDWMVERGAQRFVVTSRSGPKQPYQYSRLKHFEDSGVQIVVWTQAIDSESGARELIAEAMTLGPIGGIFHLSLVLSDGIVENQTIESFDKVFEPKSKPLVHLDELSRHSCPQLDHFVVFSSAVTSLGNGGQSNYGFTNSAMERLCERRRRDGCPALAVQWGLVGDVGYVADNITADDYVLGATRSQRMYSCLQTLDQLLQSDVTIASSVVFNDESRRAVTVGDRKDLLTTVCHILGHKDFQKFEPKTRLSELGMDSLMSVEIKQTIERDFELVLSTQEIQNLTIERIRQMDTTPANGVGGKTSAVPAVTREAATDDNNNADPTVVLSANESVFKIPKESVVYLNGVKEGRKVFYLPPTDGTYHLFAPVATRLSRPVIGLNWTEECLQLATIRETAQHFLDVIHRQFGDQLDAGFDLCGYSYGVFVAYDMCLALQTCGHRRPYPPPKLIALDMCPIQARDDMAVSLSATRHIFNGDEELGLMFMFLMDKISIQSQELIQSVADVEASGRAEAVAKLFIDRIVVGDRPHGLSSVALNEVMFAVESHVRKVRQTMAYGGGDGHRLDADVLLLRADQHLVRGDHTTHFVAHDYGFQEGWPSLAGSDRWIRWSQIYSSYALITGKCIVHKLDGNHTKFLANNPMDISRYIQLYLQSNHY
ncbi:unnamed protein product, partial [Medioppia subpectinata]